MESSPGSLKAEEPRQPSCWRRGPCTPHCRESPQEGSRRLTGACDVTAAPLHGGAGLGTPQGPDRGPGTSTPPQALPPLPLLSRPTPELRRLGRCPDAAGPHRPLFQGVGRRVTEVITAKGWLESRGLGPGPRSWSESLTWFLGPEAWTPRGDRLLRGLCRCIWGQGYWT